MKYTKFENHPCPKMFCQSFFFISCEDDLGHTLLFSSVSVGEILLDLGTFTLKLYFLSLEQVHIVDASYISESDWTRM